MREALLFIALGNCKYLLLGVINDVPYRRGFLIGGLVYLVTRGNKISEYSLILDDPRIVLNVCSRRNRACDGGNILYSARLITVSLLYESVYECYRINDLTLRVH